MAASHHCLCNTHLYKNPETKTKEKKMKNLMYALLLSLLLMPARAQQMTMKASEAQRIDETSVVWSDGNLRCTLTGAAIKLDESQEYFVLQPESEYQLTWTPEHEGEELNAITAFTIESRTLRSRDDRDGIFTYTTTTGYTGDYKNYSDFGLNTVSLNTIQYLHADDAISIHTGLASDASWMFWKTEFTYLLRAITLTYEMGVTAQKPYRVLSHSVEQSGLWPSQQSYSVYKIAYQSTNVDGQPIELSGYVEFPTNGPDGACTATNVLLSSHYTQTDNAACPTSATPYMAWLTRDRQRVYVEADYMGYGISLGTPHPYLSPQIMSRGNIDILVAVHALLKDLALTDVHEHPLPTYGIGYSQGGSVALATQKAIETEDYVSDELRHAINYQTTHCGAGCYDPLATLGQYFYDDELGYALAPAFIIVGVKAAYPDIMEGIEPEDYFNKAFNDAGIIDVVRRMDTPDTELNKLIENACGSSRMSDMLSVEAQNPNSPIMQALMKALGQSNVIRDWKPQHDVYFFHNRGDNVVPYLNTMEAYNKFVADGTAHIDLVTTLIDMDHVAGAIDYFVRVFTGGYQAPAQQAERQAAKRVSRNSQMLFRWFHAEVVAEEGGRVYATGDFRMPLSDADFAISSTAKWILTNTVGESLFYAWAQPDEGYEFQGWYSESGRLLSTNAQEAPLWATSSVAEKDNGYVSGANFYPAEPETRVYARFKPTSSATSIADVKPQGNTDSPTYDLSGRRVHGKQPGRIMLQNGRKIRISVW